MSALKYSAVVDSEYIRPNSASVVCGLMYFAGVDNAAPIWHDVKYRSKEICSRVK